MMIGRQPILHMSSAVNIVCDGNSLVAGLGASDAATKAWPAVLKALPPIAGSGATVSNVGISGQSWHDMRISVADVDGAYVAGKINILIAQETTNAINSQAPAFAAEDCRLYIAARLALHADWRIYIKTAPPRSWGTGQTQAVTDQTNADILAADAIIRANHRQWGARGLIETRLGPWLNLPDYTPASFAAFQSLWSETDGQTHHTDASYAIEASKVAAFLRQVPAS